jgi:hypothetical protein
MSLEQFDVLLCTLRIRNSNLKELHRALTEAEVYVHWSAGELPESFLESFYLMVDIGDPAVTYPEDQIFNLVGLDTTYFAAWDRFFEVGGSFFEDHGEYLLEGNQGTRTGWMIRGGKAYQLRGVTKWVVDSAPDEISDAITDDTIGLTDPERPEHLRPCEGCAAQQ